MSWNRSRRPGSNNYLDDELRSLGIDPTKKNDLNDEQELEVLVDNIKQVYYQDYKSSYSGSTKIDESHFDYII